MHVMGDLAGCVTGVTHVARVVGVVCVAGVVPQGPNERYFGPAEATVTHGPQLRTHEPLVTAVGRVGQARATLRMPVSGHHGPAVDWDLTGRGKPWERTECVDKSIGGHGGGKRPLCHPPPDGRTAG